MPQYFFDVDDGERIIEDVDGQKMLCLQAAEAEAVALPFDIAQLVIPDGDQRVMTVTLRDKAGTALLRASLSLTVERLVPTSVIKRSNGSSDTLSRIGVLADPPSSWGNVFA